MHIFVLNEKFGIVKGNYRTLSYLFKRARTLEPAILIKLWAWRMHFRQCIT